MFPIDTSLRVQVAAAHRQIHTGNTEAQEVHPVGDGSVIGGPAHTVVVVLHEVVESFVDFIGRPESCKYCRQAEEAQEAHDVRYRREDD